MKLPQAPALLYIHVNTSESNTLDVTYNLWITLNNGETGNGMVDNVNYTLNDNANVEFSISLDSGIDDISIEVEYDRTYEFIVRKTYDNPYGTGTYSTNSNTLQYTLTEQNSSLNLKLYKHDDGPEYISLITIVLHKQHPVHSTNSMSVAFLIDNSKVDVIADGPLLEGNIDKHTYYPQSITHGAYTRKYSFTYSAGHAVGAGANMRELPIYYFVLKSKTQDTYVAIEDFMAELHEPYTGSGLPVNTSFIITDSDFVATKIDEPMPQSVPKIDQITDYALDTIRLDWDLRYDTKWFIDTTAFTIGNVIFTDINGIVESYTGPTNYQSGFIYIPQLGSGSNVEYTVTAILVNGDDPDTELSISSAPYTHTMPRAPNVYDLDITVLQLNIDQLKVIISNIDASMVNVDARFGTPVFEIVPNSIYDYYYGGFSSFVQSSPQNVDSNVEIVISNIDPPVFRLDGDDDDPWQMRVLARYTTNYLIYDSENIVSRVYWKNFTGGTPRTLSLDTVWMRLQEQGSPIQLVFTGMDQYGDDSLTFDDTVIDAIISGTSVDTDFGIQVSYSGNNLYVNVYRWLDVDEPTSITALDYQIKADQHSSNMATGVTEPFYLPMVPKCELVSNPLLQSDTQTISANVHLSSYDQSRFTDMDETIQVVRQGGEGGAVTVTVPVGDIVKTNDGNNINYTITALNPIYHSIKITFSFQYYDNSGFFLQALPITSTYTVDTGWVTVR